MFNFDDNDVFSGDADIEQQQLEQAGNRIASLRKQGICLHGWINAKTLICLEPDCFKTWETEKEMLDEIDDLKLEYGM